MKTFKRNLLYQPLTQTANLNFLQIGINTFRPFSTSLAFPYSYFNSPLICMRKASKNLFCFTPLSIAFRLTCPGQTVLFRCKKLISRDYISYNSGFSSTHDIFKLNSATLGHFYPSRSRIKQVIS